MEQYEQSPAFRLCRETAPQNPLKLSFDTSKLCTFVQSSDEESRPSSDSQDIEDEDEQDLNPVEDAQDADTDSEKEGEEEEYDEDQLYEAQEEYTDSSLEDEDDERAFGIFRKSGIMGLEMKKELESIRESEKKGTARFFTTLGKPKLSSTATSFEPHKSETTADSSNKRTPYKAQGIGISENSLLTSLSGSLENSFRSREVFGSFTGSLGEHFIAGYPNFPLTGSYLFQTPNSQRISKVGGSFQFQGEQHKQYLTPQTRLTKELELVEDESLGCVKQPEKKALNPQKVKKGQKEELENFASEGRVKKPRKKLQIENDFEYDINPASAHLSDKTTLMIRNIPNKYTQDLLLERIDRNFKGAYDFLYLPIDFKNKCNVGYAFINFTNTSFIKEFVEDLDSKKWERFNSEKVCNLKYARIQGKDSLMQHFRNSSVMNQHDRKLKPLILNSQKQQYYNLERIPEGPSKTNKNFGRKNGQRSKKSKKDSEFSSRSILE